MNDFICPNCGGQMDETERPDNIDTLPLTIFVCEDCGHIET